MKKLLLLIVACTWYALSSSAQEVEYGLASYYADRFEGKPTASGEPYDPTKMTAAHKTYPFGTIIRVTRLDNGKSVEVRVNDRGPYVAGRVVDVSRAAAKRLGLIEVGRARVKVELVRLPGETARRVEKQQKPKPKPEPKQQEVTTYEELTSSPVNPSPRPTKSKAQPVKPVTSTNAVVPRKEKVVAKGGLVRQFKPSGLYRIRLEHPGQTGFGVQIASLTTTESVLKHVAELQDKWFDNILLGIENTPTGKPIYKIVLGPFATRQKAEAYKESLKKKYKIEGFVVDLQQL